MGCANASIPDVAHNRRQSAIDVMVHPDHRKRGVGRALLIASAEGVADAGRTQLLAYVRLATPGSATFSAAAGFVHKQLERCSRVETADLDRGLLGRWIAQAPERAREYSLITWSGPVPAGLEERYVRVQQVMNTAPLGDLDQEDEHTTVEEVRQRDASFEARRITTVAAVARHDPTGEWAGFTEIWVDADHVVAEQGDTGVDPAHRNRGLGRWLKAHNALRLLDEHPHVRSMVTYNAESNDPMLGINVAMGFRPYAAFIAAQAPVATVLDRLRS